MVGETCKCPHCGNEIIYGVDVVLDKCPHCGAIVKREDALEYAQKTEGTTTDKKTSKDRGCLFPAIAVIGFFAIMFIAAFIIWKTGLRWLAPIALVLMIGWAVFFSMKK